MFLKANSRAIPFSSPTFQRIVADVHGANQEIRAPVIAFIAFKLSELLRDAAWNVQGQRLEVESVDTSSSYTKFLNLAIKARGKVIKASTREFDAEGENSDSAESHEEFWLKIEHDVAVRVCLCA